MQAPGIWSCTLVQARGSPGQQGHQGQQRERAGPAHPCSLGVPCHSTHTFAAAHDLCGLEVSPIRRVAIIPLLQAGQPVTCPLCVGGQGRALSRNPALWSHYSEMQRDACSQVCVPGIGAMACFQASLPPASWLPFWPSEEGAARRTWAVKIPSLRSARASPTARQQHLLPEQLQGSALEAPSEAHLLAQVGGKLSH